MKNKWHGAALMLCLGVLIWSGIAPKDRFTWFLEVFPSFLGLPLLIHFERKGAVPSVLFFIVCLHSMVLSVGGHYTYAEVPLGFWAQDLFHFSRNHYDRLGHFLQGITPALIASVYLKRAGIVTSRFWRALFCVCLAVTFSVFYEFFEWWTALATGENATAFLGTQGDPWDTQWDMFMAFLGSLCVASFVILSRRGQVPSSDPSILASHERQPPSGSKR